MNYFGI